MGYLVSRNWLALQTLRITYRHIIRLLDDVLLRLSPETLHNVLSFLRGALKAVGQFGGGLLRGGLHELVAQGSAGHQDDTVEQTYNNRLSLKFDFKKPNLKH